MAAAPNPRPRAAGGASRRTPVPNGGSLRSREHGPPRGVVHSVGTIDADGILGKDDARSIFMCSGFAVVAGRAAWCGAEQSAATRHGPGEQRAAGARSEGVLR